MSTANSRGTCGARSFRVGSLALGAVLAAIRAGAALCVFPLDAREDSLSQKVVPTTAGQDANNPFKTDGCFLDGFPTPWGLAADVCCNTGFVGFTRTYNTKQIPSDEIDQLASDYCKDRGGFIWDGSWYLPDSIMNPQLKQGRCWAPRPGNGCLPKQYGS